MTTIPPFAAGNYAATRNTSQLVSLKSTLNDLTTQLSSGLSAQTYGGLGSGRASALSAQASISTLDGYNSVIETAQTRAKIATSSLSQVVTVVNDAASALKNGLQSTNPDTQAAKSTALNNLNAALDALSQTDGSVYLFGGKKSATSPVLGADAIINGTTDSTGQSLAGLKTIVADQVNADLGTDKNGRLTQTLPDGTTKISLLEGASALRTTQDGAFGFSLNKLTASNAAAIEVKSSGTPVTYTMDVKSQPSAGDTLTVELGLPDGSKTTVTLTATSAGNSNSATSFSIGADKAETAKNLNSALKSALSGAATSTLTASATLRASQDFFAASVGGSSPKRIYPSSTGEPTYVQPAGTPEKKSVIWYQGESGTQDTARASQTFQIGSGAIVQLGARANETAIQTVLTGLATVALGMPSSGSTNANNAYQAIYDKAEPLLAASNSGQSVQDIVTDFSLASARMSNATTANTAQKSTLQDTVAGIEQASTEEVATKLMDLQTRLQASYQITSSLSKLSLVNYIS